MKACFELLLDEVLSREVAPELFVVIILVVREIEIRRRKVKSDARGMIFDWICLDDLRGFIELLLEI